MVISHNMLAMNADRQLGITGTEVKSSTEKLSSGYRINRAADDAAGLAISEKMRKQIRGLDRAAANIEDGISFVQVADGALSEVHEMLQRINELAVQAANGTNSETDRQYIDDEVQQLKTEMQRVFETTSFNDRKIWDGEARPIRTVVGTTMAQSVRVATSSSQSFKSTNDNYDVIAYNGYTFRADAAGVSLSWTGYNGVDYETDKIDWTTLENQGYQFRIGDYFNTGNAELFDGNANPVFDFGVSLSVLAEATPSDIIRAIDNTTMRSSDSASMSSRFEDTAGNGKTYTGVSVYTTSIVYRATYASRANAGSGETGYDYDASCDSFLQPRAVASGGGNLNQIPENNTTNVATAEASSERWSFSFYMEGIGNVIATSTSFSYYASSDTADDDENYWWRWVKYSDGRKYKSSISRSGAGTLGGVMSALTGSKGSATPGLLTSANGGDCDGGGVIHLSFDMNADNAYTYGDGKTSNDVGSFTLTIRVNNQDTTQTVLKKINDALNPSTILDPYKNGTGGATHYVYASGVKEALVSINKYKLDYHYDDVELKIHSGANVEDKIPIRYELLRLETLGIADTNVLTQESATDAIDEIADAIALVSRQRSRFGAYQNRMEHSYHINRNVEENTQAAESQIRDTDMAKEMVNHSNNQVLQQAGQSMLAQANQANQGVMSLLG